MRAAQASNQALTWRAGTDLAAVSGVRGDWDAACRPRAGSTTKSSYKFLWNSR